MTITRQLHRGEVRYVLTSFYHGQRQRRYFATEPEARAALGAQKKNSDALDRWWARLPDLARIELVQTYEEIARCGSSLRAIWQAHKKSSPRPAPAPAPAGLSLKEAINAMLSDKRFSNCSARYLDGLEGCLSRFARGQETLPLSQLTAPVLKEFLGAIKNIESRKSTRARLGSLLNWAVRTKHLPANPLEELPAIRRDSLGAPRVLEPQEAKKAFAKVALWPAYVRYFTLGAMVGLRPEEAQQVTADMVRGDFESIALPAAVSKTRRARLVPIPHPARPWLRIGNRWAISRSQITRYRRELREHLGFSAWPHDLLRHTAASYRLAQEQDLGLLARTMGNSVAVLNRHYLNPRTKAEAQAFWAITPPLELGPKTLQNRAQVKTLEPAGEPQGLDVAS